MEKAIRTARELCRMDLYGGRVQVVPDLRTFIIYDVAHLPHDFVKRMHGTNIEVVAEPTSLSGFVVRVTMKPDKWARVLAVWVVLVWLFYFVSTRMQNI